MNLPLNISANDDFGLRDLSLRFNINDTPTRELMIRSVMGGKIHNQDYLFDLKPFELFPGTGYLLGAGVGQLPRPPES
jgi:hypothetical protein